MTSSVTAGLATFPELWRSLRRIGWLIAVGAIVGVVAASVLSSSAQSASATARIGLTQEVQWPFFNAARQRVAGIADGLDVSEVPVDGVDPADVAGVDLSLPDDETFINLRVTARDPETAVAVADAYAAKLVELDAEATAANSATNTALEDVQSELTLLNGQIQAATSGYQGLLKAQADADAHLSVLRSRATAEATLAEATLDRNAAEAAVQTAQAEIDRLQRRLGNLEVEQDQLKLELTSDPLTPDVEIIRRAVPEDLPASPLRTRQILGGITGAVVTALLAWVLDRTIGIIRTPAGLRSATELPVIDARYGRGAGRLAIWIEQVSKAQTIGFIGGNEWLTEFLEQIQPFLAEPSVVMTPAEALEWPDTDVRKLLTLGGPGDGHWFDRGVAMCDEIVMLVITNEERPAELQKVITDVASLGSRVSLAALLWQWNRNGVETHSVDQQARVA